MKGTELAARRKMLGYGQAQFMEELGVRSRQTLSAWENADDVPRIVVLALRALEDCPDSRYTILTDRNKSRTEQREYDERLAKRQAKGTAAS